MTSPLRKTAKGLFLHIRCTPKSGRDEICGLVTSSTGAVSLAVKVTAIPDKGKANAAVIETVAKAMRVPKSSFRFAAGETARDKVLEIISNHATIEAFLEQFSMPD